MELSTVDQEANHILTRGLEGAEKAMLVYLMSDDCSVSVRLDVNWEDAGYQIYLLMCTIMSDNLSNYIAQYKKYIEWVGSQNEDPSFYWNSTASGDYSSALYIISPYARYLASTVPNLIKRLRSEEGTSDGEPSRSTIPVPVEADGVITPDPQPRGQEHRLVAIASGIAKMRRQRPDIDLVEKFGTPAAIEQSVLYQQMRLCNQDSERENMLRQFLPCLSPYMSAEMHDSIIHRLVNGSRNSRLILTALMQYEIILRDMMEEEDLLRMADLYAIGRRSCKKFDMIADLGEDLCDVLATERLRMRFIEMRYTLKGEKTQLRLSLARHEFLSIEHNALVELGARDPFDYTELKLSLVQAIDAFSSETRDASAEIGLIECLDLISRTLITGILECLKSIGTDRIELPDIM